MEDLNLIAADIVEVAVRLWHVHFNLGDVTNMSEQPAYDTNAEHTTMAAADVLYEIMSIMVKKGPLSRMMENETYLGDEL